MFLVTYPCECNRIPADGGRSWTQMISLCPLSVLQAAWFAHGKHWFPACLWLGSQTGYMWKGKIQLQNAQLCLRWSIAKYQSRNSKNRLLFLLQKFFFSEEKLKHDLSGFLHLLVRTTKERSGMKRIWELGVLNSCRGSASFEEPRSQKAFLCNCTLLFPTLVHLISNNHVLSPLWHLSIRFSSVSPSASRRFCEHTTEKNPKEANNCTALHISRHCDLR